MTFPFIRQIYKIVNATFPKLIEYGYTK